MADTYRVTRSIAIEASPDEVFAHLVDFHRWQAWSPWEGLDPQQSRTYTGPASGVGAHYAWSGNKKVGSGTMEVIEAQQPSTVAIDLRFLKPFKSQAITRFDVQPSESGSAVTWTMDGAKTLAIRIMGLFKSMDAMIGPDFEKGLAQLKAAVEAPSA
jgi:hypothetical protein